MIYTDQTKKALRLMFEKHRDQVDKSGMPYVFHPFHVAEQMTDEKTTVAALLHDVVEDTDTTLDDLLAAGFDREVVEAVGLLTRDKTLPYLDYVRKLKGNPIAAAVKRADLAHNSDLTRLDDIGEREMRRLRKYREALIVLSE